MYVIGTKNEDGTANFCVITWLGFSFDETPHIMMTIGGNKLTKANILREKAFSANLITEDTIWLADYFGCSKGEEGEKNLLKYGCQWGKSVNAPTIDACSWVYECEVTKTIELRGSHLFLAEIRNIQIDSKYADMDMQRIDLRQLRPAIYAPYNYFSVGEKIGNMGEWEEHMKI
ncbi:MAG TPA: flavin reductase [Clostridia bacterium]|nr:flavin reductase [Clostridia bacterium]